VWFGRPSAVGTHSAGCLPSSPLYGFGAGSLVGVLRCSRDTAPRTYLILLVYYTSTLITIRLSS